MKFSKIDYFNINVKEYRISGSKIQSKEEPVPTVFESTLFASNPVVAKSLYFKQLNKQYKIKRRDAVVLRCIEVKQASDFVVKNYRITFVYRTRTGFQNAYKEIRHVNKACAVSTMFQEFGSRHKVRHEDIYISTVEEFKAEEATKAKCLTYSAEGVKFPIFKKIPNTSAKYVPIDTDIFN
ncbi:ribosomal prt L18A [Enterospora canceri]|uniref:60S ribosomal protein L20 n=1 Tax=Enterospora canceri TaxID=1081671 RepID=A0A1Y1SAA1_9MICR|nr:ribosomal prt L18A [Enterospora canceri]